MENIVKPGLSTIDMRQQSCKIKQDKAYCPPRKQYKQTPTINSTITPTIASSFTQQRINCDPNMCSNLKECMKNHYT